MNKRKRPKYEIVCLCGSTRFRREFAIANRDETLAGNIVVAPGVFPHDGDAISDDEKTALDCLHFEKILIADRVLVVAPGEYVGDSTKREIEFARSLGIPVRLRTEFPAEA